MGSWDVLDTIQFRDARLATRTFARYRLGERRLNPPTTRPISRDLGPVNQEIVAGFSGEKIVHFPMPRNRRRPSRFAIHVHSVVAFLAQELTPVLFQMADQVHPFHSASKTRVSRMTSAPSRDCADSARFASRTIATASFRFARASSSVSP